MRAVTLALLAVAALAACGKYGPPVRTHEAPAKAARGTVAPPAAPAATPGPVSSNTEECDDPNAAAAAQVKP